MRNLVGLGVAALLTGCAAHQAAPPRIISTEWAAVEALSPGTNVAITAQPDEVRTGEIKAVTPGAITLREARGVAVISRGDVSRVAVRDPIGKRKWPNVVRGAAVGLAITALPAIMAMTVDENGSDGGEMAFLFLGPALGAGFGAARAAEPAFRERIIYIRP